MTEILSFLDTNNSSSDFLSGKVTFLGCILIKTLNFSRFFCGINNFSKAEKYSRAAHTHICILLNLGILNG